MRRLLFITTILAVVLGLLFGGTLLALQLSSPTGNVGDEGLVAVPIGLLWVFSSIVSFITAIIYFVTRRPKGRDKTLPLVALLFPVLMIGCFPAYASFQYHNGLVTGDEAITLVKQCKVKSMLATNHKRWKLNFIDNRTENAYITYEDYPQVHTELTRSKSVCDS